jgi:hypothetical protein
MGRMLTAPGSNAVAFSDTEAERKALKPIFPIIPREYPSRGIMARIIYQEDGTIRAEFLPGVANYSSWMARKIPWARWRRTGEGCWLGATVTAEEAEYVVELTKSGWSEGGEYVIIRKAKPELEKIVDAPVAPVAPIDSNEYREQLRKDLNRLGGKEYNSRLREAVKFLGETNNANRHGVYVNCDTVSIPFPKSLKTAVEIKLAIGADKKWRFGNNYTMRNRGGGSWPSIFDDGYSSREDAIHAAVEELKTQGIHAKHLDAFLETVVKAPEIMCEPPKFVAKPISRLRKPEGQLPLFDLEAGYGH